MWLLWGLNNLIHIKCLEECLATKWPFFFFLSLLSDGKLDVSSNCVYEEQPQAETTVSQVDCNPKECVEGERAALQCDAGLEGSQDATAGPQVSEE